MSAHEGVSCDFCLKGNFRGRRYKCLVCYDYDLCDTCYEAGTTNTRHTTDHPMQCILTRADFDLFYGGEALSNDHPQSYTCPYCSRMGFTETSLQEHVTSDHADTSFEVVCPVCAAMPGGDSNLMTDDFAGHLTLEHRASPRDLISFLDEPMGGRHNVRRVTHSSHLAGGARGGQAARPRRSNMHFRESVDPIAELLSQLSGVRRSAGGAGGGTPSQLQQLQMQLQLERQQVNAARQQLERMPRRQNQAQNTLREAATAASPGYGFLVNPAATQTQPPQAAAAASAGSAGSAAAPTTPSHFLLESLLEELSPLDGDEEEEEDGAIREFAEELLMATMTRPRERAARGAGGAEPKPARVLRGRARSDGLNAARRADANKADQGRPKNQQAQQAQQAQQQQGNR